MPKAKKSKVKKEPPKFVLHYWNSKGSAEVIRICLVLGDNEWTEVYNTPESMIETKKKAGTADSPFGQWPLLVMDDIVLAQAHAISKHLSRPLGLYGKDKTQDYLIDSFMIAAEALEDAM